MEVPRIRERARRQAATRTGLVIDTRARFGFTATPGTTDDTRIRYLTLALPRSTRPASSPPRRPAPMSGSCATSPPRAWGRCTSATPAAARLASRKYTDVEPLEFEL
ncbi:hypothetical protein C1I97_09170 [Streptomyces sp. NTH33]|nr:hypothetical protein C1I97_09170 [Streptomyces sp. NTH33]